MKLGWTEDDAVFKAVDLIVARYGEPDFRSKEFHCYRDLPIAWRMPLMTNVLEGEIENGGLAQFLWNTFHHYRRVLQDSADGYALVGASKHAAAVDRCVALCSRFDAGCRVAVEAASRDKDGAHFEKWYEEAESEMTFPEEDMFGSDSEILQVKGRWILAHMDDFRELIK
jgi:hypothetical protein